MPNYSKRFTKDVGKLIEFLNQNQNQFKIIEHTNQTFKFQTQIKQNKHIIIQFTIDPLKYPFTPPIVLINKTYYLNLLKTINILSNQNFHDNDYCKNKFNLPICVHCSSIVCDSKWTPFFKLINVYKEIYRNFSVLLRIKEMNCGQKCMIYFGCESHLLNDYF